MSLLLRLMFVAVLIEIIIASGVAGDPFGAEFVSPPPAGPAEDFAENLTWRVDDIQKVRWNASFSKYSIVLWQQMTPTMARRGPTILDTTCNPSNYSQIMEFGWKVQSYDLDLSKSQVFFLRLVPSTSTVVITSHYFNISWGSSSVETALTTRAPSLYSSTTPESESKRNLTTSSTLAVPVISTSIAESTTTTVTPSILATLNATASGNRTTRISTPSLSLTPGSTTVVASAATLDPLLVATKPRVMPSSIMTLSMNPSISTSSTPHTSQTLRASSSQQAQVDSHSKVNLIGVAVTFGVASVSIGGVFIFWKVQKRKNSRLEVQRRQRGEQWPRVTIFHMSEESFPERPRNLGNNDASEVPSEARPPVELESQRPAAEMPGD